MDGTPRDRKHGCGIRPLEDRELEALWSIDRSEVSERVYRREGDALVLVPERHDVRGWPPGERERYEPLLRDCFERGGTFLGAFDDAELVGAAVLECRFLGRERDRLQLAFLHVSRPHRGRGVGRALFDACAERARELGARQLYVSSTTTENTVGFYLERGCRPAREPEAELVALEPDDIHLECDLA